MTATIVSAAPGFSVIDHAMTRDGVKITKWPVVAWEVVTDPDGVQVIDPKPISVLGPYNADAIELPDGRILSSESLDTFETIAEYIASLPTDEKGAA